MKRLALYLLLLSLLLPGALLSQRGQSGGGCFNDDDIECVMVTAREGRGSEQRQWVRTMVLWRVPRDLVRDPSAIRAGREKYETEVALATARKWSSLGGTRGGHYAVASFTQEWRRSQADSVFVAGHGFVLPARDSVLVVLVDQLASASVTPRVEASLYISTTSRPPYPFKRWVAGESVVTIAASESEAWLRELLQSSSVVREYLGRAPKR